jgi:hypothetical protein
MESRTRIIESELANGTVIYVQAMSLGGDEEASFRLPQFEDITKTIHGIAESLEKTLDQVKPQKASVEFGLAIGVDSGKLTTILVNGTATANLKITFEWSKKED